MKNERGNHLPRHWQDWIARQKYLQDGVLDPRFEHTVVLQWVDGSHALFNYAFCVMDEEHEEIGVFTEHCGYHVFQTRGLEWKSLKNAGRVNITDPPDTVLIAPDNV